MSDSSKFKERYVSLLKGFPWYSKDKNVNTNISSDDEDTMMVTEQMNEKKRKVDQAGRYEMQSWELYMF